MRVNLCVWASALKWVLSVVCLSSCLSVSGGVVMNCQNASGESGLTVGAYWFLYGGGGSSAYISSPTFNVGDTRSGYLVNSSDPLELASLGYMRFTIKRSSSIIGYVYVHGHNEVGVWTGVTDTSPDPPVPPSGTWTFEFVSPGERGWLYEVLDEGEVIASGMMVPAVPQDVELPDNLVSPTLWWIDPATGARYQGVLAYFDPETTGSVGGFGAWEPEVVSGVELSNSGLRTEKFRYSASATQEGVTVETGWQELVLAPGDSVSFDPGDSPGYDWDMTVEYYDEFWGHIDESTGKWVEGGWKPSGNYSSAPTGSSSVEPPSVPSVVGSGTDGSRWENPTWVDDPPPTGISPAPDGNSDLQHRELIAQLEALRVAQYATGEGLLEMMDGQFVPGAVSFGDWSLPSMPGGIETGIGGIFAIPSFGTAVAPSWSVPLSQAGSGVTDAVIAFDDPTVIGLRDVIREVLSIVVTLVFLWSMVDLVSRASGAGSLN